VIGVKPGVRLIGCAPQVLLAVIVAEQVLREHEAGDAVITSMVDGTHGRGSLHYVGHAVDLRTRTIPAGKRAGVIEEIRSRLGDQYDVIPEVDHLHIEWQPKGG